MNYPHARHNLKWRYTIVARIEEVRNELWIYENGIKQDPTEILKLELPIKSSDGVRYIDDKEWIKDILTKVWRIFGKGNYKIKDFSGKGKAVGNRDMILFKGYFP